jgi:hypothetical protein
MIKKTAFLILTIVCSSFLAAQTNHVIVIDKTGSMIGRAGGKNIWQQVKDAIKGYVQSVDSGDQITIYTYDSDVSEAQVFPVSNANAKNKVNSFIDAIVANGLNTCTYRALKKVIGEYDKNQAFKSNLIYLYTDGLNNCTGHTMKDIADMFKAKRDDYDYLYYITLGYDAPADVQAAADAQIITQAVADPANKINIVPKTVDFKAASLTFDFSNAREVAQVLPLAITGELSPNTELICELAGISDQGIDLMTTNIPLKNNQVKQVEIKIKIKDSAYFDSDIDADIKVSANNNVSVIKDKIKTKLITPKKRKITVTIK